MKITSHFLTMCSNSNIVTSTNFTGTLPFLLLWDWLYNVLGKYCCLVSIVYALLFLYYPGHPSLSQFFDTFNSTQTECIFFKGGQQTVFYSSLNWIFKVLLSILLVLREVDSQAHLGFANAYYRLVGCWIISGGSNLICGVSAKAIDSG